METTLSAIDVNLKRQAIQDMAYRAWEEKGRKGTIVAATGIGKSKLAVRRVTDIARSYTDDPPVKNIILLVTPTETLRDDNWPAEFKKWGALAYMDAMVKRICYASLKNEKGNHYRLVILDEMHHITENNAEGFRDQNTLTQFFTENLCDEVMALTATEPDPKRDIMKWYIAKQIAPVCFRYSLDQAVADGIVAPYQIRVILVPLDKVQRVIPGGTKDKPFMQTEFSAYEYLEKAIKKAFVTRKKGFIQKMIGARLRFIINLPSKTRVAKKVLEKVLPGKRTLVFCGSIEQSRQLCGKNVFNSSKEDQKRDMLTAFKNMEIDYLGVVNAVNEGENIDFLDQAVIVQLNSNERDLVQRVGRMIRYRPGHKAMIYVIIAQDTKDMDWAAKALAGFDRKRIVYDSYLNYLA